MIMLDTHAYYRFIMVKDSGASCPARCSPEAFGFGGYFFAVYGSGPGMLRPRPKPGKNVAKEP